MTAQPLYRALAESFAAEGVDTQFVLMGDGNMHFSIALHELPGTQTIHVRHEHCAVAAATAYAIATERVGVASVTCGPGLSQVITALPAAVRASVPLVVFAGEPPIHAKFYNQDIDQAPMVTATGARYIRAHSVKRMHDNVREAFHYAKLRRTPVVLGIPYDLQKAIDPAEEVYVPSAKVMVDGGPAHPDPQRTREIAERLANARYPVLIGGRGAFRAGARDAIIELADETGALLANTLPVRGMFDDHPFSLGVAGGYASDAAREAFAQCDLLLVFGASLSYYTLDGGRLFPNATIVHIDTAPHGWNHGMAVADLALTCDAAAGAHALTAALNERGTTQSQARSDALKEKIATQPADAEAFNIASGVFDPREVIAAIDRAVPKDWDFVTGSGHQAYFNAQVRGRPPERFLTVREFGAIGNGLSYALGVAAARRQGAATNLVLVEGDGGLMMHIQELETAQRHGLRLLICVMNDGAYGSEIHKLRADGLSDELAVFGRTPFEEIAQGFGLRGQHVKDLSDLPGLFAKFREQPRSEVWNFDISDQVTAPTMRKIVARGHGVM